jgi:predicted nucleic acid-binding Zn ribbon protein
MGNAERCCLWLNLERKKKKKFAVCAFSVFFTSFLSFWYFSVMFGAVCGGWRGLLWLV